MAPLWKLVDIVNVGVTRSSQYEVESSIVEMCCRPCQREINMCRKDWLLKIFLVCYLDAVKHQRYINISTKILFYVISIYKLVSSIRVAVSDVYVSTFSHWNHHRADLLLVVVTLISWMPILNSVHLNVHTLLEKTFMWSKWHWMKGFKNMITTSLNAWFGFVSCLYVCIRKV